MPALQVVQVDGEEEVSVVWQRKSFGFEAMVGDGVLRLIVFYEHGWKVGINDKAMNHIYPNAKTCKRVAINWVREKLKVIEAELKSLERLSNE